MAVTDSVANRQPRRRRRLGGLALTVAAGLLAACALKKPPDSAEIAKDAMPTVVVPAQWTAAGAAAGDVSDNWLAGFRDDQLMSIVYEAIVHNPNLQVTAARVEQAELYAKLAGARVEFVVGRRRRREKTARIAHHIVDPPTEHGTRRAVGRGRDPIQSPVKRPDDAIFRERGEAPLPGMEETAQHPSTRFARSVQAWASALQRSTACSNIRSRLSLNRRDGKVCRTPSTRLRRTFRWCRRPISLPRTFPIGPSLNEISRAPDRSRLRQPEP